jgi:hypothetical protein
LAVTVRSAHRIEVGENGCAAGRGFDSDGDTIADLPYYEEG